LIPKLEEVEGEDEDEVKNKVQNRIALSTLK